MLTTCQGFQNDKIWSKFQLLCSILQWCLRHCRRGIFYCHRNDREGEMMSQTRMLGVISRPKPSLESTPYLCRATNSTGKFLCCFPPSVLSNLHHSARFLKFSVSHQSHWLKLQPLDVSPVRQRYCRSRWPLSCGRLQVIWHLSHSHLLQDPWATDLSVCVLGLTWHVCKWDRVRGREWEKSAVPHYTYDGSVGGWRKMN